MDDRIKLKCPEFSKEFSIDDLKSKRCPYCGEYIDVFSLTILKNQKTTN